MLYFFLFAVLLMPIFVVFSANTENEVLKIQAALMLPFKQKIKLYAIDVTAKKIITLIFSGDKKKGNRAQLFNIVKRHAKVKSIFVKSRIGTGDAATTAMLNGGVMGIIAPFAAKNNYSIDILPEFEYPVFEFSGKIIFRTNFISALIAILKVYRGSFKWKSIRLKT